MGIRVHKVIGYGTDTIQTSERGYDITDSRIDAAKLDALEEKAHEMSINQFIKWLEKEEEGILKFHLTHNPLPPTKGRKETEKEKHDWERMDFKFLLQSLKEFAKDKEKAAREFSLGRSLIWQGEYGIPKVMIFIPPSCPSWYRYDDTIDYHEETTTGESANRYRFLENTGIYPWNGRMIRIRDPKPGVLKEGVNPDQYKFLDGGTYNQLIGRWDRNAPALTEGETLKHLKEDYRPIIPIDVSCVLWFFRQAFLDLDRFYNELRPMLYVYWA